MREQELYKISEIKYLGNIMLENSQSCKVRRHMGAFFIIHVTKNNIPRKIIYW